MMRDATRAADRRSDGGKGTHLCLVLPLLVATACRGSEPAVPAAPPEPPAAIEPGPAPSAKGMVPMKKVEILVGGCMRDCGEPVQALTRFLEALADPDAVETAARFVDSTRLVVDGRALGAEWAAMWKELRAASRRDAILEAVRSLASWARDVPPDRVRALVAVGPRPVKLWTTESVFEFDPGGGAEPWTFVLRPRGLEWLVVEVRTGIATPAGRPAP